MKLLCAADLHLGRHPSRLPDALSGAELGPAAAWRRTVDAAIEHRVHAVLLAGDVVEDENDFFEAYADLREGVERLAEAGIRVLGVSGNHDVRVLPRLAEAVESFTLLGRGGRWESEVLEREGRRIRILGWSFPERTAATDPLAPGVPAREGAVPTIGLLHADRDQPRSRYAPVRSADLRAAPVDAWFLGHVHKPDDLAVSARPIGYLGSIVGTDPGEPGPHGPWLVRISDDGGVEAEHLPLAPLRWEGVEVDVGDLQHAEDVRVRIAAALDALHERIYAATSRPPRAVGCRLRLTGRTALRSALRRALAADDPRQALQERDGVAYFVEDWRVEALPAIDLDTYAQGSDPLGLVARKLLALRGERDHPARAQLIATARERLGRIPSARAFRVLGAEPPDDERLVELLEAAALRTLDALVAQREGEAGG